MSLKKIIDFIAPEEEDEGELTPIVGKNGYEKPKGKGVNVDADARMVLFEPRSFEDSQSIAVELVNGKACIVNFHRLQIEYAQRSIDFLSGVIYAFNGTIKKIDSNVYLCSPKSDVSGDIDLDNKD